MHVEGALSSSATKRPRLALALALAPPDPTGAPAHRHTSAPAHRRTGAPARSSQHRDMSTQDLVNKAAAELFSDVRRKMFDAHVLGTSTLWNALTQVDWDNSGEVTREDFNDSLNYAGIYLSSNQLTTLQKFYAPNPNSVRPTAKIPTQGFLRDLGVKLNERRVAILEKAWAAVGGKLASSCPTELLLSRFTAAGHPLVLTGTKSPEYFSDHLAAHLLGDGTTTLVRPRKHFHTSFPFVPRSFPFRWLQNWQMRQ